MGRRRRRSHSRHVRGHAAIGCAFASERAPRRWQPGSALLVRVDDLDRQLAELDGRRIRGRRRRSSRGWVENILRARSNGQQDRLRIILRAGSLRSSRRGSTHHQRGLLAAAAQCCLREVHLVQLVARLRTGGRRTRLDRRRSSHVPQPRRRLLDRASAPTWEPGRGSCRPSRWLKTLITPTELAATFSVTGGTACESSTAAGHLAMRPAQPLRRLATDPVEP